jgi:dTDP-glucose 4,6-dehydratase
VTGAAGFIGTNLAYYLSQNLSADDRIILIDKLTYAGSYHSIESLIDNERIVFVQADICDAQAMDQIFIRYAPNFLINLAAESHVDRSIENPSIFVQTNVLGVQTLLDTIRRHWAISSGRGSYPVWRDGHKMLQVSTDEVYGSLGREGYFLETTPLNPRSPYSASKASGDLLCQAAVHTHHAPVVWTRCSNNYGPYQFPEKLIPLVIRQCLLGKEIPIYGTGENIRDWLYVTDHCRALYLVVTKGRPGTAYNIGGHNEHTNLEIVQLIIDRLQKRLRESASLVEQISQTLGQAVHPELIGRNLITFVRDRLGHDARYGIDPTFIHQELGWLPTIPFTEGIGYTIDWYLDHFDWVKSITDEDYQNYYQQMYQGR